MAKWDVIFSHRASSRIFKRTVDASGKTQAVITAQAEFDEPHQWNPVVAAEVPAEYYERIDRVTRRRDADIERRELAEARDLESFATYNEE